VAQLLTSFVRRLLTDPTGVRAALKCPQLVWEAPPRDSSDSGSWQLTESGGGARITRPQPGEALIYAVEKVIGASNPFPMGVTIGRVESNDLVLDDASVSRFHAWLQFEERTSTWWLTDAESRNGTWVGGMKCEPRKRVAVSNGTEIRVGDAQLKFFMPDGLITFARSKME
jgi:hypothetical protein